MNKCWVILVGIGFIVFGCFVMRHEVILRKTCTVQTTGEVIDIGYYRNRDDGKNRYSPKFRYVADGETVEVDQLVVTNRLKYKLGQTVTLFYDPFDYERYYVKGEINTLAAGAIFSAVGLLLIIIGVYGFFNKKLKG